MTNIGATRGATAPQAIIDRQIEENGPAGEQPTHGHHGFFPMIRDGALPLLAGGFVTATSGFAALRFALPRIHGKLGIAAAIGGPLLLGAASGFLLNRHFGAMESPSSEATPLGQPKPNAIPGITEGSNDGVPDSVATVHGFTDDAGPAADAPLSVGNQIGRLAGYHSIDEAAVGAAGQDNALVLKVGGVFKDYAVATPSQGETILNADRADITRSTPALVAVVRDGSELYRAEGGSDELRFSGSLPGTTTGGVIDVRAKQIKADMSKAADAADQDYSNSTEPPDPSDYPLTDAEELASGTLAKFLQATDGDGRAKGDGIVGPKFGYPTMDDAVYAIMARTGDQAIVHDPDNDRYIVVKVDSDANPNSRLVGIQPSKNLAALEFGDRILVPAGNRMVSAEFTANGKRG
jgi:hypothetical protein